MDVGTPTSPTSRTSPQYPTSPSAMRHRPIRPHPQGGSRPPWIKPTCRPCPRPGVRRNPERGRPRRTALPTARCPCDQKCPSASHPRDHRSPRGCRRGQQDPQPWSQCRSPLLCCPGGCLRARRASTLPFRHGQPQKCQMPAYSSMSRMMPRHLSLWRPGPRTRR